MFRYAKFRINQFSRILRMKIYAISTIIEPNMDNPLIEYTKGGMIPSKSYEQNTLILNKSKNFIKKQFLFYLYFYMLGIRNYNQNSTLA